MTPQDRHMGAPLFSEEEYNAIVNQQVNQLESTPAEPFTDFEFDMGTNRMRCAGYTPEQVAELLRLYREHMTALVTQFGALAPGMRA